MEVAKHEERDLKARSAVIRAAAWVSALRGQVRALARGLGASRLRSLLLWPRGPVDVEAIGEMGEALAGLLG